MQHASPLNSTVVVVKIEEKTQEFPQRDKLGEISTPIKSRRDEWEFCDSEAVLVLVSVRGIYCIVAVQQQWAGAGSSGHE